VRTNPIPVNMLRDCKRGCVKGKAGGVVVEKKGMGAERAEGNG